MAEMAKPVTISMNKNRVHSTLFTLKFHEGDEDKAKIEAKQINTSGITLSSEKLNDSNSEEINSINPGQSEI